MRLALRRLALPSAIAFSLAACEPPPPPVPVAPPPTPPPPPKVHRPVAASWSFHAGEVCSASAASSALALDVTASSSTLTLTVRLGHGTAMPAIRSVPIEFSGAAGNWSITGHKAPARRVMASQPMTEEQAGRILVLLDGGTIRLGRTKDGVPALQVPNSGAAGRHWFECVRRQLFP